MYPNLMEMEIAIAEHTITLNSIVLKRRVTCTMLMPEEKNIIEPLNLLLLNDGQEAESLHLKETLEDLNSTSRIKPLIIAAIHANEDRVHEYGVAGKPDFKKRGSKAGLYTEFIKTELLATIAEFTGV